jgi:hypothetical protein
MHNSIDLGNGVTLNWTTKPRPDQGHIDFTMTGGTFTGSLILKGGPDFTTCTFTNVTSGTCSTTLDHHGALYPVNYFYVCPGTFLPTGTTTVSPASGTAGVQSPQSPNPQKGKGGRGEGSSPSPSRAVAEEAVATTRGQLPFTGLPVIGLFLLGSALMGGGGLLRRT